MSAVSESGQRRIITADEIVKGIRGEADNDFPEGLGLPHELPSFPRNVHFLRLANTPVLELLHPDSGEWPEDSQEAEQQEALEDMLGESEELLDLTPQEINRALRRRPWDGSFIDIFGRHAYHLRLLTTGINFQTGKRIFYDLSVENTGQRRGGGVYVRQCYRFCSDDEINLQAVSRR